MTKPILQELKFFVNGVSNVNRGLPPDVALQLVKCSLNLLENLPSSREAVLEYYSMVFDASVHNYMRFIANEPNGTPPEDESISDIQDALENLVVSGPPAWAPLISSWSLRLLGTLSQKHNDSRKMDIASSCTQWLGSNAMRCLLGLAASCFGKLKSIETENCITIMLATFEQNSPYFDWVVARLGGCFPLKVISKILQCGLKAFVANYTSSLASEVSILTYLSYAHEKDLKFALNELLQNVLFQNTSNTQAHVNTLPFLMRLSGLSEELLQPIIGVFMELFNDSLIPTLVAQSMQWPKNFNVREILPSLSALALTLKMDATKTVLTLARIAENFSWAEHLLEHILQELETLVWNERSCPLLNDLTQDKSTELLRHSCISETIVEQQTAVRLLLLTAPIAPYPYHQTIAKLLTNCYAANSNGLQALIRIVNAPAGRAEYVPIRPAIELALDRIVLHENQKCADDIQSDCNVLKNLVALIRLEKQKPDQENLLVTQTTNKCISKILDIFGSYLKKEMKFVETSEVRSALNSVDDHAVKRIKLSKVEQLLVSNDQSINVYTNQIHILANLLNTLEIGNADSMLGMEDIINLSQLTVKYFFWSLIETCPTVRITAVNLAFAMLNRQCTVRKASRTIALRELLEGSLFLYGNLFGAHNETDYYQNNEQRKDGELLMKLNQRQGSAPNAIRSILHAGIIGHGLKVPAKQASKPDPELQNMFLSAIAACCKSDDMANTIDGFSTVSLLLVEMVSTDVMYNGLPWPDEEIFTKVTMERDLQIRRTFRNAPILWGILGLLAAHRPAICFTSVLLRALCASVLHQWRAKTGDRYHIPNGLHSELYDVTKKLLEIMAMGQLLPPPLSYLHTVVEQLDAAEIAVVLKECIWNYMKDNVPSPVLYGVDVTGLHWRDSIAAKPHPQYVDPLRSIMQRKLPKLGTFYHHMFVLSELSENLPKIMAKP